MRSKQSYVREYAVFAMLGTIMFLSKLVMEFLPNIHLVGVLTVIYTIVYRHRALIPIYVCVMLIGLFYGFTMWWLPYLYIWTILWGAIMLVPRGLSKTAAAIVYPAIACLHGFLYGTLYAPAQALLFKLDFEATIAWIVAGFPFDLMHGVGNLVLGLLIPVLVPLLTRLSEGIGIIERREENVSAHATTEASEDTTGTNTM